MDLPTEYNIGFDEARRLHSLSYLKLQSDSCYQRAAENYRTTLQMSLALERIFNYDGAVHHRLIEVYNQHMDHSKKLMGKINNPGIAEIVKDIEYIQNKVSRIKTI